MKRTQTEHKTVHRVGPYRPGTIVTVEAALGRPLVNRQWLEEQHKPGSFATVLVDPHQSQTDRLPVDNLVFRYEWDETETVESEVTVCDWCGSTSTVAGYWYHLVIGDVGLTRDLCSMLCAKAWIDSHQP